MEPCGLNGCAAPGRKPRLRLRRTGLCLLAGLALPALVAMAAAPLPLQPLIDAAPAGATLRLAPGAYAGPVHISRALTLDGGRQAVIVGDGRGTVLSVAANGVTLRGLRLTGSGELHDHVDAGILLEGDDHRVEDNQLDDVLFGIHLKHVVLYSPGLVLRGNHVAHALTDGGGGIVFKESNDALVEHNEVLHCSVGLRVDAPPQSFGALTVRHNRFAHNIVGMYFYGEEGGHRIHDNRFENNLNTVAISAPGAGSANLWRANFWDDYRGFDRNRDGVGDTPHEVRLYADRIWMETPMTTFFRNSPVLEILDFLERLAPFSSPHLVLRDPAPRMR